MIRPFQDGVGLGWRPELAAGIFEHRDVIDVVEVIADDYFAAPRRKIRALQTLALQIPVTLHGVGMGLASATPVAHHRLEKMARLVDEARPWFWSEHLAFVRSGGFEIGHLAAPPRTPQNVEATVENLSRAAKVVGSRPMVENIATLVDPPGSSLSEAQWISAILEQSGCDLLLDLHNVFANGFNHGYDPAEFLSQIPADRIGAIHLAGGQFITAPDGRQALLDDHRHDVPDPVYGLLEEVAVRSARPLPVILERDGAYDSMERLLAQLQLARRAMERGRRRRAIGLEAA